MKPLVLDSSMTNMGGTFYPTGHVFALFRDEEAATQAVAQLQVAGRAGETFHATPEVILQDIAQTLGNEGEPLPSVGAESDMVRRIADLASSGHHGLLIAMGDKDEVEGLTSAIALAGAVAAFYYRTFVIEDLITTPLTTTPEPPQSVVVGTHAGTAQ